MTEDIKQTQAVTYETVIEAERERLKLDDYKKGTGIAISGGGIRSASFGLGVLQALVSKDQLKRFDYMSTVSGGGYLGAALTWALNQGSGTSPDNFPFGKRRMKSVKENVLNNKPFKKGDNNLLDFVRQHGFYLTPTSNLDIISFAAVVLRAIVLSLFVYIGLLTIFMTLSRALLYSFKKLPFDLTNGAYQWANEHNVGILFVLGIFIFTIILLKGFLYSLSTFLSSNEKNKKRYKRFIHGQISIGILLKISIACFVFGSLPYVSHWLNNLFGEEGANLSASTSTLLGSITGIWQYQKAKNKEHNTGGSSDLLIYLGAAALFYGVLLLAYQSSLYFFTEVNWQFNHPSLFIVFVSLIFIFGFFTNLNLIGPHHIWRDRLMEAFMPDKEAVDSNNWMPAEKANKAQMSDMCNAINPKPYHIVNTNVILSDSLNVKYSGRGGDNFIISPLYCGSDATGWKLTKEFQKNNNRSGITLATAMATSAAALNPDAGVSGEGVTRNIVVSILLSLLNLRLGFWTSNPSFENNSGTPNFLNPGLTHEILRKGLSEKKHNLLLSDGGHYENLALYELIRRKLSLIVVSDGGADPNFNFDDLANAVEKVRVDFGAKISFIKGYELGDILPGTAGHSDYQKKYAIAKHGFAIADIFYDDGSTGVLVYLKLAMIEDMSTDVFSYKGVNPAFPHQSTADQFFNEKQFEAYRELGYYVTWQMMESDKGKGIFY